MNCYEVCPVNAIKEIHYNVGDSEYKRAGLIIELCVGCGLCSDVCQQLAIGEVNEKDNS
ncbi:MAG: 4Fe-4S binding protein [Thermoplasmatales archaeon]|nr:MAG: 4Fe-4S binding protein [Thermoplasmatales archaeon]